MIAFVYYLNHFAGYLEKNEIGFTFKYSLDYLASENPAISFSFPKTNEIFTSVNLFPFFYGLLAEGTNKEIQCRTLKIDENDDFTRLLKTANSETIGAITVKEQ